MSGWLGVVSAAHVRRAQRLGIAQVNHGRRAGLARMRPGDTLVYYSPVEERGDTSPLRAFTALGIVADDEIWQADEGDFKPYRRRVVYAETRPLPLSELHDRLHLTAQPNWGYQLRRGLIPLDEHDIALIRDNMEQ
ncbi:EVE domain-containing protein [Agromyces bauzanensis]